MAIATSEHILDETEKLRAELVDLLYIISHDFNAPIRHVNGFASLLRDRNLEKLDDKSIMFIEQILQANARMSGMLDGLLSISRINTRQTEFQSVGLGSLIGEILHEKAMLDDMFSSSSVRMSELATINCDRPQVTLALTALIDNAFLYRQTDRDFQMKIEPLETDVTIGLSVHDNGLGIDERFHSDIFKPLRRAVAPTDYPGHGVGLTIVSKVMERHGGKVSLTSKLGEGSAFKLQFPKELQVK